MDGSICAPAQIPPHSLRSLVRNDTLGSVPGAWRGALGAWRRLRSIPYEVTVVPVRIPLQVVLVVVLAAVELGRFYHLGHHRLIPLA